MTTKKEDELIDRILDRIKDREHYDFFKIVGDIDMSYLSTDRRRRRSIADNLYEFMQGEDLIMHDKEAFGRAACKITHNGTKIVRSGGWQRHVEMQASEKIKDQLIKNLTIKDLKGSIFQMKYALLFAVLIVFLTTLFTIMVQVILKNNGVQF
jgi:hypothetical protein